MLKALCIVLAAVLLSACGGSDEDTESPDHDAPLSSEEVAALSAQCRGRGRLVESHRVYWAITIDGVRIETYARGTCADGSAVQLVYHPDRLYRADEQS